MKRAGVVIVEELFFLRSRHLLHLAIMLSPTKDRAKPHKLPLEAVMGATVIRRFVKPYDLVPNFAPAGAEEKIMAILRAACS